MNDYAIGALRADREAILELGAGLTSADWAAPGGGPGPGSGCWPGGQPRAGGWPPGSLRGRSG
jgi:hypothetical protein